MREKILQKLEKDERVHLNDLLKLSNSDQELVTNALKELQAEYQIAWTKENVVYKIGDKYKIGSIKINDKGFGFVKDLNDIENDYFVAPNAINGAISTDEVVFTLEKEADGRLKANVEEIALRTKTYLIGEIHESKDGRFLDFVANEPGFKNYRIVMVNSKDYKLKKDLIIKVKILDVRERKLFTRIQKIIGDANKAIDRIISIAYEFDIKPDFNKQTIDNAQMVAKPIDYNDPLVKRRKKIITDKNLVTIDGADSKDLDDAVYVEKTATGYKLFVAIADVSYYVTPFSPLDNTALFRGNSVYLANKVIPMLPEKLSNGVCSLNPNEDKLCMVAEMDFDMNGNMIHKKVYESVMNSKARLTYNEVNELFSKGTSSRSQEIIDMLMVAKELHELIDAERSARGAIEFDVPEPKIILDKDSNVIDIVPRGRGVSEKLIENFMVSANEAVAQVIFEKELPYVYRNHGIPKEENLIEWHTMIRNLGINVKLTDLDKINPKTIRSALKQIEEQVTDQTERDVINVTLLRFMEKAAYELDNIGHFGLASRCYTHFTSPIRRYSDLMVHRFLKQYLIDKDLRDFKLEQNTKFINKACNIINETEKQAVNAEREVNKVCMAEYMTHHIEKEYTGVVAAVLKFGLFIQLENCVEGLIHISELPDYTFDEKANIMVDKQNKMFRLGQKVKIKVKNADVKKRIIDFVLA
ncbi:ribonuclease R [Spiroplasma culicicola]|uniref:Ribonuclease R n=1 Tax=Spiroplasma culicicola AES-1 TaxID=1276246 RepID=W6A607_9MOLU|nr:ribonuclease R [Spiroplasma culicicola]AHI52427.1 ribonuclease R [Spiroplasma culicicola AES-1]